MQLNIKKTISRLLPKNAFIRSVSILVGGTAGAQVLMMVAAPLLTRLYSPEDFGLLAVYTGILSLFNVISSLRYELAIPLPEDDQTAAHIAVLCVLLVVCMTGISGVMVYFAGAAVAKILNVPKLADYFWLLPIGVLLIGIYQVFNYWAIRTKSYSAIAVTKIRQILTTVGIQLATFKAGGVALLIGQACGQSMGSLALAKSAIKKPEFRRVTRLGIKQSAARYRQFPIFDIWYGIFFTAGQQFPPIMFASLFGTEVAGLYAISHRVLALPSSVIGGAIANVFFSNASEAKRSGNLRILFENVNERLMELAMPPAIILFVIAPEIFVFAFGEQWREAGTFARFMSIWVFMNFVTSPLTTLFTVMEKQKHGAVFQAAMLIIRLLAILIGAWFSNIHNAIIFFSLGSAFVYLTMNIWMAVILKSSISRMLICAIKIFGASLLAVSPLILFSFAFSDIAYLISGLLLSSIFISIRFWSVFKMNY